MPATKLCKVEFYAVLMWRRLVKWFNGWLPTWLSEAKQALEAREYTILEQ